MANVSAIHSVGNSIVTYLRNAYPPAMRTQHPCTFSVLSSNEVNKKDDSGPVLSFFLYRVTVNEHLRTLPRLQDPGRQDVPLALDLHYLMTMWADGAEDEHTILAWAMRQLHMQPLLDTSVLSAEADWSPGDVVQLMPMDLANEELMRIWDALEPPYRLSVAYLARVVRIDPEVHVDARPVVATRITLTDRELAP